MEDLPSGLGDHCRYPSHMNHKRYSLRFLLALSLTIGLIVAVANNWHRASVKFNALQGVRTTCPNQVMICYDFMTKLNEENCIYEPWQSSGYLGAKPPLTTQIYCNLFEEDFACTPRVLVFFTDPNQQTMDYVAELPDVKQVVHLCWNTNSIISWKRRFPNKKLVDYFKIFPIDG